MMISRTRCLSWRVALTAPFRSSQRASQTLNNGLKSSLRACDVQPPGQGGIKILAAVWSPCEHAAQVPAIFVHEPGCASVHQQNGGHSSCMQILVRTVHTVQQTVFWLGFLCLLLCNDRCPGGARRKLWIPAVAVSLGCGMLGSTVDTCSSSSRVAFGRISTIFRTRILGSILVVHCTHGR